MLSPQANVLLIDRLAQVGNICRQWANIELHIALAIWCMMGIDSESGAILTGGLNMSSRVVVAIKLAKHLDAPSIAIEVLKATQKALDNDLEERRNQAIHGVTFLHPNEPSTEIFEMHRGKRKGRQLLTNKDLNKLSNELAALGITLHRELTRAGIFTNPCAKPTPIIAR